MTDTGKAMASPEQIEKVRRHLSRAKTILTCQFRPDPGDAADEVEAALAALNGEQGEEVWEAHNDGRGWRIQKADFGWIIAEGMSEADARRIARLPALERAARGVIAAQYFWQLPDAHKAHGRLDDAINALRAALTDKPEA